MFDTIEEALSRAEIGELEYIKIDIIRVLKDEEKQDSELLDNMERGE